MTSTISRDSYVNLAHDLKLPLLDLVTRVTALLGNRGGGKSNGAVLIVEQVLEAGQQVVVLDYVGIWYGLRLDRDGKSPSRYQVPILGGQHGDIELSAAAGAVVAEALAASRSSAIIDLSLFSKTDRCRFATDFAEAFFVAKKHHVGPVLVVLEESQRFIPQQLFRGQERMLGAWSEIAEVGRNFGIGLMLISQRPQKLSKDVLNLADNVFAFRTNGVLERKALHEWVQEQGAGGLRDIADQLPGLPTGYCYVWVPEKGHFGRHGVRLKNSYDSGATPAGQRGDVATAPLDLKILEAAMGKAAEEASRGTPAALREECRRLREELDRLSKVDNASMSPLKSLEKLVREQSDALNVLVNIVGERVPEELDRLVKLVGEWRVSFERDVVNTVRTRVDKVLSVLCTVGAAPSEGEGAGEAVGSREDGTEIPSPRARERRTAKAGDIKISTGELRTLSAIVQYDAQGGATREMLTVLTGYKRSSRDTFLSKLRAAGLVEPSWSGANILATEAGRRLATEYGVVHLPQGRRLREYWQENLSKGEWNVLHVAILVYPKMVAKEKIRAQTDYSRSSLDTFLSRLRIRQLVVVQGDQVRAADILFDSARSYGR